MDFQTILVAVIALVRLCASIKHGHCLPSRCLACNLHNTRCLLLSKNSKLAIFSQELPPANRC